MSSKNISIEAKKIKVVKKLLELMSVQDIQVFLDFANFHWQFIQSFSRIVALLTLMLKTAAPPEKSTLEKAGDGEGDNGIDGGDVEIAKKSRKLKDHKLAKSQKLSKSRKSKGKKSKKPPKVRIHLILILKILGQAF